MTDVDVRTRLLVSLATTRFDFRTEASLTTELNLSPTTVRASLERLAEEGVVRNPVEAKGKELTWWRLTNRGATTGEKLRTLKTVLSRS